MQFQFFPVEKFDRHNENYHRPWRTAPGVNVFTVAANEIHLNLLDIQTESRKNSKIGIDLFFVNSSCNGKLT